VFITYLHKTIALLLTFVLLTNSLNNAIIIGDFIINQDLIAKTLCIQKEAQKGCNGKCQLNKELVQSNTDSNSELPILETKRLVLDYYNITDINHIEDQWDFITVSNNQITNYNKTFQSIYSEIDTPPPIFS